MAEIVIIGGGAAGMMAAIAAARADQENRNHVTLLEKNEKLGKKLFTGLKPSATRPPMVPRMPEILFTSAII